MRSERPIRVGVPAWTLVPGGMGGSETYAREVTRALAGHADVEVTTFVGRGAEGLLTSAREVVGPAASTGGGTSDRLRVLARALVPDRTSRAALRRQDVLHYPFSVPLPRAGSAPRVVTLHDVQHLDLPDMFTRAEREYRRLLYDGPARRAAAVVTVSAFCATRIVERLGIPADRVRVIPLGVDAAAYSPNTGARERFVLYPAAAWPHKNHHRLVTAMGLVRDSVPDLRLVLTGARLDSLGPLPPWVEVRGHVPLAELHELYRAAACLAFPSLYEGFGLPTLEAMASGCPVAASGRGAVPEVCGQAAVLFDPDDEVSIATGIQQALERSTTLTAAGLSRIGRFTWERCAEDHVGVYRDVAGASRG